MELLQIMGQITKVTTLVDGGAKVSVDTAELTPHQMTSLFSLKGKSGWFVFRENQLTIEDIPEIDAEYAGSQKSHAQRLRGVLYRMWEQNHQHDYPEFEVYYAAKLDRIIKNIKEKLQ